VKAVVYARYGSPAVLRLADVEQPAPKDNEVLIKVALCQAGTIAVAIVE
jgi:NADPH:quinone reductase-like Zn-dependent oxidoreductase